MSVKASLKAAKAALDAKNYDETISQAEKVLTADAENYFACLFLGRALDQKGRQDEAANAYERATKIKPDDDQAWQGLRSVYEKQGAKNVSKYVFVSMRLAEIFAEKEDLHRCQVAVDNLLSFASNHGTRTDQKRALEFQLPSSPIFSFLEGRLPNPSYTYIKVADIIETEEKEKINREIGNRRTRIGARVTQVTTEVKREVILDSPLEKIYQSIIDWTPDDDVRIQYSEKLLQRFYDTLVLTPLHQKGSVKDGQERSARDNLLDAVKGAVILKRPFELAWKICLEWQDAESFAEWSPYDIQTYLSLFSESGLAKVLRGYLGTELSPFPKLLDQMKEEVSEGKTDVNKDDSLSNADRLLLMTDGLEAAKESPLAHRLMANYYLHLEEYDSAANVGRQGVQLLAGEAHKSGLDFQHSKDAMNSTLATALIYHQSPKNHPEAKSIFESILKRKSTFSAALIGIGLILEQEQEFPKALDFLTRALARDPENSRVAAEAAWCKSLNGQYAEALDELQDALARMDPADSTTRDLRSQTHYRIGQTMWKLDPSRANRKDRHGPYASFLAAIKTNANFAPAYTSLGIFYEDYARDRKRSRQCFQKAFELSPAEVVAAERLARHFADRGEWDIVELLAQRVVDYGHVRPPPGSKEKGISWPYSALGVVQMNKQEYNKSVISFLSALRIDPDDYHSYVGLGESYHNSGRYNSAARSLKLAQEILSRKEQDKRPTSPMSGKPERWFTEYMLANVNREMGEYQEAIRGYRKVLLERNEEFGVSIALLQTLVEEAWRNVETGFYGRAVDSVNVAIAVATDISKFRPEAFNLWKALGDACSILSWVQRKIDILPLQEVKTLLGSGIETKELNILSEIDGIGERALAHLVPADDEGTMDAMHLGVSRCLHAALLAQKRAIFASTNEIHAQAVAWFNLGWTEYRAYTAIEQPIEESRSVKPRRKFLTASMRCFKRAIELEAGNSEFWDALGVTTTLLNPRVAQHSFIRSLHLNERSARTWTNLGTLYLQQNDLELAHTAFARGQSSDPDYAHAWLGQGLVNLLWGESKEALSHFTHAFEISDASSLVVKRQFGFSAFDHLISSPPASSLKDNITNVIQPLFALQRLYYQTPANIPARHLAALFFERVGNHDHAIEALEIVCTAVEAEYEDLELSRDLIRFAQAKSDLARNRLAVRDYAAAAEDTETALDLMSTDDGTDGFSRPSDRDTVSKVRLSARLTAGLSHYYLGDMSQAISDFRSALEESGSAPDVICMLAEVLWATGKETEKGVAREQLFGAIEQHSTHVGAMILLGAMSALDADSETMEAVREDLHSARTQPGLDTRELRRVEVVLDAMAALSSDDPAIVKANVHNEVATSIVLAPGKPHGWAQLAAESEEPFAAQMALRTAEKSVPPHGPLSAAKLAKALAGTDCVADALRAVVLAPWLKDGWESVAERLE
ncbi:hypothetical protein BDY21DRAFT_338409 [Lineolata rhizophorae]|uniref:Translation repressor/antiviral protein Ski3 n=1 Tax=Lineolata rhizophorae TaxID=578093 RepID=A0A6A6P7U6_9PEZI|nr:hypothetical protein BDY21DRAFT_338409 [Lineolata rhizophorae]